jgi:deoxyadenosine/deoxycytidine kinase
MLHHDRKIDTLEYALYQKWLDQLLKSSTTLGAVIHVNTPADICAARVKSRHRGGEEDIPLEYLKAVGQYQQAWVDGLAQTLPGCPVHTTGYTPIDSVAEVEEFVRSLQSL